MRCALVEAETREEVMREMEERMSAVEAVYSRRLMREVSPLDNKLERTVQLMVRIAGTT